MFEAFIQAAHLRRDVFIEVMFEFINVMILPVMLIVYYAIQRLVVHHSAMELKVLMHYLIVESMHKHAHDFDD
ncbi:hypothetical protein [Synechococcus sp. MIT S9508]|uniref:hypothetical protein n=1 Tax=Synechococcus sp. MIT S9508 TaxID=1801629 RepID=UPI0012E756F7|nr:hypothetical protein [Synechococcus sp. MIT S9508]